MPSRFKLRQLMILLIVIVKHRKIMLLIAFGRLDEMSSDNLLFLSGLLPKNTPVTFINEFRMNKLFTKRLFNINSND